LGSPLKGVLLALALATLYLAALDRPELSDPDESRHAAIAREMLETGRFLTPRLSGRPYYDKPVGVHWTVAGSLAALGTGTAAARVPAALSALTTLAVAAWWATRLGGARAGRSAALMLGTCGLFLAVGRLATVDMLFTALLTAAVARLSVALGEPSGTRRSAIPVYALIALACLVKGPVAIVLATPVLIGAHVMLRRSGEEGWLRPVVGIATLLAIAVPWYAAAWSADPEYVEAFLGLHNLDRFVGTDRLNHQRSLAYYALTFPAALLPWTPVVALAAVLHWKQRNELGPGERVLWLWVATIAVVFGAASTRLITYLLPAFPALFVSAGCGLAAARSHSERLGIWLGAYAATWLALVAGATGGAAVAAYVSLASEPGVTARSAAAGCVAAGALALVSRCVVRRERFAVVPALATSTAIAVLGAYGPVADLLTAAKGYRALARDLAHAVPPDGVVSSLSRAPHALSFYLGRPIGRVEDLDAARALLAAETPVFLLTKAQHADALLDDRAHGFEAWWRNAQGTTLVANGAASQSADDRVAPRSRLLSSIEKSALIP
jgi:4-amino-4-deoxy-L-arabinose transferase-like glycosyltransferase